MTCQYCKSSSYITIGKCLGCVARYMLRTVPTDKLAASIKPFATKYQHDEVALRDEMARQWTLAKQKH